MTILLCALLQCFEEEVQGRCCSGGKDARPRELRGVRREKSLDDALRIAAKEKKPVLLFQLVGDLDREGC
jgi:hypothetical protein